MAVENRQVKIWLHRLVAWSMPHPSWHEDLMQEAMVHWWRQQTHCPGHTLSWYQQSCKFHLKNCLAAGRSIDSLKRRHSQTPAPEDGDWDGLLCGGASCGDVLAEVSAAEIVALLTPRLNSSGQGVLHGLYEGLTVGEIARKLRLSHQAVSKQRARIATLAEDLGIARPRRSSKHAALKP